MEKMTNVKALAFAIENGNFPTEVVEKLTAIRTSFEKKSATKKPTANQTANEEFKATILEVLADGPHVLVNVHGLGACWAKIGIFNDIDPISPRL